MDINANAARLFCELLLDDSSSSSSEDEGVRGPLEKRPRVEQYIDDVVARYTEVEFQQNFRLNRGTFNVVLEIIKNKISSKTVENGRPTVPPKTQLLMALWYLGTPDSYRSVCGRFDLGKATGLRATR
ncbi:uncharacterized protein LOC108907893 [Anoplophora glabripennis]|uniref:uncharacterized protein LOC108907893 n=1 Tax=Anoplophora glabripennis TaxID=217634 RepID=UPI0008735DA9|nr:uncharacterized protein LOC108907893 [Anoplophora glabripennis]